MLMYDVYSRAAYERHAVYSSHKHKLRAQATVLQNSALQGRTLRSSCFSPGTPATNVIELLSSSTSTAILREDRASVAADLTLLRKPVK